MLPVCKDSILPPIPNKPPDMFTHTPASKCQLPKTEDEPVDIIKPQYEMIMRKMLHI